MEYDGWYFIRTNRIHNSAVIADCVELGEDNIIYPNAVIGLPGFIRDLNNAKGKVIIGNGNRIGTNVSIMIGTDGITKIGDNNLIMNYVNIGHDAIIGNSNEIGAGTIIAGWVQIGDRNKIKLDCTIRNRVKISDDHIFGMRSNITESFEGNRGWLVYGNPAKKVKLIG
jgi:UDP-N-acetylglucosamine acyltransferase